MFMPAGRLADGHPAGINTDAHSASDMDMLPFGVATARRGWVQAKDVLNTWQPEQLLDWLRGRG